MIAVPDCLPDLRTQIEREFDAGQGITLGQAAALVPSSTAKGRRACAESIWRWCKKGKHGVKLEHLFGMRGDYVTTAAAVRRFLRAVAEVEAGQEVSVDRELMDQLNAQADAWGIGTPKGKAGARK